MGCGGWISSLRHADVIVVRRFCVAARLVVSLMCCWINSIGGNDSMLRLYIFHCKMSFDICFSGLVEPLASCSNKRSGSRYRSATSIHRILLCSDCYMLLNTTFAVCFQSGVGCYNRYSKNNINGVKIITTLIESNENIDASNKTVAII